jgi:glycine/D-amino acid oxidase-like deaminating enzyme
MAMFDTIIIGGGISGLACARRLHRAGRDFRLISDRLGGRMYAGPFPMENFGATYITADYTHVREFVRPGRRLRVHEACFVEGERCLPFYHPRLLEEGRSLCRVIGVLVAFRRRFNRFRAACPEVCQAELLRRDPQLERAVQQPAAEFLRKHRLERLAARFIDPVVRATLFARAEQVNVFYLLASILPIVVPSYLADLSGTVHVLTAGYRDRILSDRVVAAETSPLGTYRVSTDSRDLEARHLVVATPAHNTRLFFPDLDVPEEHDLLEIPMHALHVQGPRHPRYRPGKLVYLAPEDSATALLPIRPDLDLVFAPTAEPDLSRYYDEYTIAARVHWKTAVQLARRAWRRLEPRPDLFTIGDYNICGLEDSYLTGIYAANRILA